MHACDTSLQAKATALALVTWTKSGEEVEAIESGEEVGDEESPEDVKGDTRAMTRSQRCPQPQCCSCSYRERERGERVL